MILTIKSTTNNFTIYFDNPLTCAEKISLLGAVIIFPSSTIPSETYIYCDKIDSEKRLYNGKRKTLLALICSRVSNQIGYDSKQKITIPLANAVGSLTFSLKDKDDNDISFTSVVLEVEIL